MPEDIPPSARATAVNQPVVLENFAFWSKDCEARPFSVVLNSGPANGTFETRDSTKPIPERAGIGSVPAKCVGIEVASKELVYTPANGFAGSDQIVVEVGNQSGRKSFRYVISVQ
ncbi:MAG: hypothetical protein AAF479_02180 [Pseudomonadota bacterium]